METFGYGRLLRKHKMGTNGELKDLLSMCQMR